MNTTGAPAAHSSYNSRSGSLPASANHLLDAFIPGYTVFSHLVLETAGVDVSRIVPFLIFAFVFSKAVTYIYRRTWSLILQFATCSASIDSDVDAYFSIMDLLSDWGVGKQASNVIVLPLRRPDASALDAGIALDPHTSLTPSPGSSVRRKTQNYEPILESYQYFWYKGNMFIWYRRRERRQLTSGQYDMPTSLIQCHLFCFSRTTAPIKDFVEEAAVHYNNKRITCTKIRWPANKKQRQSGKGLWQTIAVRPSRPLDSVVIDQEQKDKLLADMRDYLRPSTRRWYSVRGIPYRRGYLFHGPPGTGKTSMSLALAGVFNLNIFCVSLAEPSITEEDLVALFNELPEQCLVLLEDVDSAGIRKRNLPRTIEDGYVVDDTEEIDDMERSGKSQISLSGLLNVIDGVASSEGRVLIMTTNDTRALDKALLRPGRVDVQIGFKLASKNDAKGLFAQTFGEHEREAPSVKEGKEKKGEQLDASEIQRLAGDFAALMPEQRFSPADIQGYLLTWKNGSPIEAVANLPAWIAAESR